MLFLPKLTPLEDPVLDARASTTPADFFCIALVMFEQHDAAISSLTPRIETSDPRFLARIGRRLLECRMHCGVLTRLTHAKEATVKKVLITGAGTGFGHEAAMRLAEKGFDVIATVEIWAQIQTLKRQAKARGVTLAVEKLDVTSEGDRRKALAWDVEILVNNAGVLEGGSVLDIPEANMRHQFEVNVIGPLLLTQGIAKQMVKRGSGRIVWVSSREGLNTNPFTGIYSASKHAVEAVAETMSLELQEFGIEVATVNPGPFLTGFNERGFETRKSWEDDQSQRLYDYSKLAFPRAQFDPEPVYVTLTAVAAGEVDTYRNLEPRSMLEETKHLIDAPWHKRIREGLGTRPASLQKSYEMKPETPASN